MSVELRPAVPADAIAVARVHVRAWQAGYRGILPAAFLDGLQVEERATRYTFGRPTWPQTTVAIEGDTIVGFVMIDGAELGALYVDPDRWSSGVGRALMARARADLAAAGVAEAHLWLLAGNTRAQRFYERDGWTTDGTLHKKNVWTITVDAFQYRHRL